MNRFYIKCPGCAAPVSAERYNIPDVYYECPGCRSKLFVGALPALYRPDRTSGTTEDVALDDAACFYHAEKKAEQLCDDCGRFLCGLCALPLGEEVICSSCLEIRRKQEAGQHKLKPRQLRKDKLALGVALAPLILYFPLTIFTAPAALLIAIRYWNHRQEFAPGRKARMLASILLALAEIIGWILFVVFLVTEIQNGN